MVVEVSAYDSFYFLLMDKLQSTVGFTVETDIDGLWEFRHRAWGPRSQGVDFSWDIYRVLIAFIPNMDN